MPPGQRQRQIEQAEKRIGLAARPPEDLRTAFADNDLDTLLQVGLALFVLGCMSIPAQLMAQVRRSSL